ncbi:hypothetical protein OG875_04780 [Streptomyces sp. NBC_01498]|uniref:hypothetical protein n=1 Tax=Streptomyces sp. NBC_01498 TaxID=2975870 RepID=UPI002E7B27E9|nr:hypothetical protein [Streptomyces sp. NBC_01498]WTL23971.1 hypothetical protein OG875_04780 [Streptomyces sp. NBC_01498]
MPAYLITHAESRRGDMLIEDPNLTLTLEHGWAGFRDKLSLEQGSVVLAIPAEQTASIQRVDDQEPAPHEG